MSSGEILPRRDFIKASIAGALGGFSGCVGGSREVVSLDPRLDRDRRSWTFVGSQDWSQDDQGSSTRRSGTREKPASAIC